MILSSPRLFQETNPTTWRLVSAVALLFAVAALWISPEFSLINLGLSLTAGLASLLISMRTPKGILTLWIMVFAGAWLSPLAGLPPSDQRVIFAFALVAASSVFQGALGVYATALVIAFGLALKGLGSDLDSKNVSALLTNDSLWILEVGLIAGVSLLYARVAHTRARHFKNQLRGTTDEIEKARNRVSLARESLQITRETLLGRALADGENLSVEFPEGPALEPLGLHTASFGDLVGLLRKSFADFQTQGRADGRIAGPIRFVFFAPAAGYDEKSIIAVDLAAVVRGLEACLSLALESLPEIGARRREGVIRLSIRYGLRLIEIAVEDNGRGLSSRNLQVENDLGVLKDLVQKWGGKLDRLVRLGVGSRTSLELRIVRESTRSYRATLKHPLPIVRTASGLSSSSSGLSSGSSASLVEDGPRA